MFRALIAERIEPQMRGNCEHAGMLARAIVVDRLRLPSRLQQCARRPVAYRPMCTAGEKALIQSCLSQEAAHRRKMHRIATMRAAGNRKLLLAQPERIGRAALDERNRL